MLSRKALSALLLGALTWLLLLSSPANTAPIRIAKPHLSCRSYDNCKPHFPRTKQELRDEYFMRAPPKDKSCFFTGMDVKGVKPTSAQNTHWAKQLCHTARLTTLDAIWRNHNMIDPSAWKPGFTQTDYETMIVWMSEIFAEETTGTAYVFMADGFEPRTASIFFKNEFGAIKASQKVPEIKRLRFSNDTITDPTEGMVWWKMGDKDPESRP